MCYTQINDICHFLRKGGRTIFNQTLKDILNLVFNPQGDASDALQALLAGLDSRPLKLLKKRPQEGLLHQKDPLNELYILISGTTYTLHFTLEGRRVISDTLESGQIFGLIEVLSEEKTSRAAVHTLTDCLFVKVNRELFLKALYEDPEISQVIMHYLARFSNRLIAAFERRTSVSAYESLLLYLYNRSLGQNFPCRIKEKKSFIADALHVDKRTLYRYLNRLSEADLILREGQSILITRDRFSRLADEVASIHH